MHRSFPSSVWQSRHKLWRPGIYLQVHPAKLSTGFLARLWPHRRKHARAAAEGKSWGFCGGLMRIRCHLHSVWESITDIKYTLTLSKGRAESALVSCRLLIHFNTLTPACFKVQPRSSRMCACSTRAEAFVCAVSVRVRAVSYYPQGKHVNRFGYHWEDWLEIIGVCVRVHACRRPDCLCLGVRLPTESGGGEGGLGGLWLIHCMGFWLSLAPCIATAVQRMKYSCFAKCSDPSFCAQLIGL